MIKQIMLEKSPGESRFSNAQEKLRTEFYHADNGIRGFCNRNLEWDEIIELNKLLHKYRFTLLSSLEKTNLPKEHNDLKYDLELGEFYLMHNVQEALKSFKTSDNIDPDSDENDLKRQFNGLLNKKILPYLRLNKSPHVNQIEEAMIRAGMEI